MGGRVTGYGTTRSDGFPLRWTPLPICGPEQLAVGIQDGESGDLIYNNAIYTNTTASTPKFDLYTGHNETYRDRWNVHLAVPLNQTNNLSVVQFAAGFDIKLYGSIVNVSYQGGNFWWDFGDPDNPNSTRPYTEHHSITYQGDSVPLTPLFNVTFVATVYTPSSPWNVSLTNYTGASYSSVSSSLIRVVFAGLNASQYDFSVLAPFAWSAAPAGGAFDLFGPLTIPIVFMPIVNGTLTGTVTPASARLLVDDERVFREYHDRQLHRLPDTGQPHRSRGGPRIRTAGTERHDHQQQHDHPQHCPDQLPRVCGRVGISRDGRGGGRNESIHGEPERNLQSRGTGGTYMVEAVDAGFVTQSVSVNVLANKTTYANFTLVRAVGTAKGLSALDWELIGIGVAALIVVLAVVLIASQRRNRPPDSTPEPPGDPHGPTPPSGATGPPAPPAGGP